MASKKRGLGRDLSSLLSSGSGDDSSDESLRELAVDLLQAGQHQPRRTFDAEALDALTKSIRAQGIVQPIVVRPVSGGRYEIVAGERRWRAAKNAGLEKVPALVRQMDERSAMAVAIVENIQRADLNPLEEAGGLKKLIDECGLTHEQCAQAVGRSRAAVSNLLRLFDLNEDVRALVAEGALSLGHAKVLLGVSGPRQSTLAQTVVVRALSVRQTEALVAAAPQAPAKPPLPSPMAKLESELAQKLGARVQIQQGAGGRGKLVIGFADLGELERVVKLIR